MSIASRIQEIETHIGDIYDTLEVGGTDLTDLNKNIVNINSSLKDRYKYFLNNGVEVIWNNWEKVIGEGTEFTLENTIQAPMKVNLKGNTYQKSTTGKNIFDKDTIIANKNSFEKSGSYYKYYALPSNYKTTITVSMYLTGTSQDFILGFTTSTESIMPTNNRVLRTGGILNSPKTFDFSNAETVYLGIGNGSGISENLTELDSIFSNYNIQVELGSSATDYEEYTGNISAPNPDYPQDIHVVSGDNNINVVGKNLFDINATKTDFNIYIYKYEYTLKPNTQYTISSNAPVTTTANIYANSTSSTKKVCAGTPQTITSDNNGYFYILVRHQSSGDAGTFDIYTDILNRTYWLQIEEGTTATTYEPYQKESYPINLGDIELCEISDYKDDFIRNSGKNLFDKNDYSYYDGYISGTGTTSIVSATNNKIIYIPCLSNTQYTISKIISMRFRIGYSIDIPNADINVYGVLNNDNGTSLTITTGDDAKYLVVYLQNGNLSGEKSLEDIINSLQIEEGDQVTKYEPYGTGKWYLHKETGKYTFTGSESFTKSGRTNNDRFVCTTTSITPAPIQTTSVLGGYFNRGIAKNIGAVVSTDNNFFAYNSNVSHFLGFDKSSIPNWDESATDEQKINLFKSYLTNNTSVIVYVIKTPTYTEITDATLLNQLEAVYKAISHDDQTNISQVNNDIPFKLEATALKNI